MGEVRGAKPETRVSRGWAPRDRDKQLILRCRARGDRPLAQKENNSGSRTSRERIVREARDGRIHSMYVYIYIYICIEREMYVCMYIYIYIYIYVLCVC